MFGASSELASVMEFGFNRQVLNFKLWELLYPHPFSSPMTAKSARNISSWSVHPVDLRAWVRTVNVTEFQTRGSSHTHAFTNQREISGARDRMISCLFFRIKVHPDWCITSRLRDHKPQSCTHFAS